MKYLEDLIYWIKERERIRLAKEAKLPRPWTQDPILQQYRFCNVYREHDVVTQWIHNNWLTPKAELDSLPFAIAVSRLVNWIPSLQAMGYPHEWSPLLFKETMRERRAKGLKSWTSAYMITGGYVRRRGVQGGYHSACTRHPVDYSYSWTP